MIDAIAVVLVLAAIGNAYFVRDEVRWFRSVSPRSPVLLALLGVTVVVWGFGIYFAIVAARYLADLPDVFPFGGVGLGVVILIIELLPLFIWTQMRLFIRYDADRNDARDAARDASRDPIRDEEHDADPP